MFKLYLVTSLILLASVVNTSEGFGVSCLVYDFMQIIQHFFMRPQSTSNDGFTNNNLLLSVPPPDCVYWPPRKPNYINKIDTSIGCRPIQPQTPFDYKRV
jgi:hypothetical protein